MKLVTDYSESYDGLFDGKGPSFERVAFGRGGLTKRQSFELFERLCIPTPLHGTVKALKDNRERNVTARFWPENYNPLIVVYNDEYGHCGEGKSRSRLLDANDSLFASEFITTTENDSGSISYRMVRFGHIEYWLQCTSKDWRSNVDGVGTVFARRTGLHVFLGIERVLWAIDFVPSNRGLLAIDFNTCPCFQTISKTFPEDQALYMDILEEAARLRPNHLKQF